jgi:hypothetical protein
MGQKPVLGANRKRPNEIRHEDAQIKVLGALLKHGQLQPKELSRKSKSSLDTIRRMRVKYPELFEVTAVGKRESLGISDQGRAAYDSFIKKREMSRGNRVELPRHLFVSGEDFAARVDTVAAARVSGSTQESGPSPIHAEWSGVSSPVTPEAVKNWGEVTRAYFEMTPEDQEKLHAAFVSGASTKVPKFKY